MIYRIALIVSLVLMAPCLAHRGTVVLLHGFQQSSWSLTPMRECLEKDGWETFAWEYPSRERTIEQHARCLVAELRRIATCKAGQPIYFVTNSMGALIVRAAINLPSCPQEARIGAAVLLAPPNRGSELGRTFRNAPLARQLMGRFSGRQLMITPDGGFERLGHFPRSMPILVIAGTAGSTCFISCPNDGVVTVRETALSTPYERYLVPVSHTWIVVCPDVLRLTRNFLRAKAICAY